MARFLDERGCGARPLIENQRTSTLPGSRCAGSRRLDQEREVRSSRTYSRRVIALFRTEVRRRYHGSTNYVALLQGPLERDCRNEARAMSRRDSRPGTSFTVESGKAVGKRSGQIFSTPVPGGRSLQRGRACAGRWTSVLKSSRCVCDARDKVDYGKDSCLTESE
jgi:hypothetical protein